MSEPQLLGLVGAIGIASFAVVVAVLSAVHRSFLRERGWDPVRSSDVPYPSILALSSTGRLQAVSFAVLGVAVLAVTAGLWASLDPRPTVGILVLAVAGIATLALTAPTDGSLSSVRTWHGAVHAAAFFVLLISVVVAAVLLGWALPGEPTWAGLAGASIGAAVAIVVFTGFSFLFAAIGGLASILSVAVILAWLELLALGLVTSA